MDGMICWWGDSHRLGYTPGNHFRRHLSKIGESTWIRSMIWFIYWLYDYHININAIFMVICWVWALKLTMGEYWLFHLKWNIKLYHYFILVCPMGWYGHQHRCLSWWVLVIMPHRSIKSIWDNRPIIPRRDR